MNFLFLWTILVSIAAIFCIEVPQNPHPQHILRERAQFDVHEKLKVGPQVAGHEIHVVEFVVKYRNLDKLDELLTKVSDPGSEEYGRHWTRDQIAELIGNLHASRKLVKYLESRGAVIVWRSVNEDHITAHGPISLWEEVFHTTFHTFQHKHWQNKQIFRALEYSLPVEIHSLVEWVFEVVDFPPVLDPNKLHIEPINPPESNSEDANVVMANVDVDVVESSISNSDHTHGGNSRRIATQGKLWSNHVTPQFLMNQYSISNSIGSSATTQAIFASLGQYASQRDLSSFQTYMGTTKQSIGHNLGLPGHIIDTACKASTSNCGESNLDVQYIMGIGQAIPTTHMYYDSCDYTTMLQNITGSTNPPKVISISYGGYGYSSSYVSYFNTLAQQAGLMGITIVVSSGDDGVANFGARNTPSACGYTPSFPAYSPYVLAVGATQGPEKSATEIACSYATSGVITTGGGFSTFDSTPSWQSSQVSAYFSTVSPTPVSGYATNGRGYPDISMIGSNYIVNMNGSYYSEFGTSASAPVIGGMIALLNNALVTKGYSTLGFVNPLLYTYSSSFITDITSGDNKCTATSTCCTQGFTTTTGWDPVTGLGVPNYDKLLAVVLQAAKNASTPTSSPTIRPSNSPTAIPTTASPTMSPTCTPTNIPTTLPTLQPSYAPVVAPTTMPSISMAPTYILTNLPTISPTLQPVSLIPSGIPSGIPSLIPTISPSLSPSSISPSISPSAMPIAPTGEPTSSPIVTTAVPTGASSSAPSSISPTTVPTVVPTTPPSVVPTILPTFAPSSTVPTRGPTVIPPTFRPSLMPSTAFPTAGVVSLVSSLSFQNLNYNNFSSSAQDTFRSSITLAISNTTGIDAKYVRNVTVSSSSSTTSSSSKVSSSELEATESASADYSPFHLRFGTDKQIRYHGTILTSNNIETVVNFIIQTTAAILADAFQSSDPAAFVDLLASKLSAGNNTALLTSLQAYIVEANNGSSSSELLSGLASAIMLKVNVIDQTPTTSPTMSPSSSSGDKNNNNIVLIGVIVGVVVGGILIFCLAVGIYFYFSSGTSKIAATNSNTGTKYEHKINIFSPR